MTALILVCGLPGSGKSFFAQQLSKKTDAIYFNSDVLRKQLFPEHRTYSEYEKAKVYSVLSDLAEQALYKGRSVIVDATFYKNTLRIPFYTLAEKTVVPLHIFYIQADEALIRERTSVQRPDSEADYAVYLKLRDQFEPIDRRYTSLVSDRDNIDQLISSALDQMHYE